MKRGYGYILYFLLSLVILGGLALLAFRSPTAVYLGEWAGLNETAGLKVVVKTEILNTDIFKAPSFTALKNNVINFDFNRPCTQPVLAPPPVVVGSDTDNSTTSQPALTGACVVGSGLPFVVDVPKK